MSRFGFFDSSPIEVTDSKPTSSRIAIVACNIVQLTLCGEITESALVNVASAQSVIDELRRVGVRIALDDFGTGYATLTQLLSFHLDKIKIDRSFVSRLDQSEDSLVIVRAILGLAKGFGLTTTAEGIEDVEQLARLKEIGCAEGQGYLFGKAVPAAEIAALLKHAPVASSAA